MAKMTSKELFWQKLSEADVVTLDDMCVSVSLNGEDASIVVDLVTEVMLRYGEIDKVAAIRDGSIMVFQNGETYCFNLYRTSLIRLSSESGDDVAV